MKKLCLGLLLLAVACSSAPDMSKMSAEELYNKGYNEMQDTAWSKAAESFEKVELEHPYSKWAVKAKLMSAYAYYKDEKYDDAVISLDRFIRYHPGNKDIAYAYALAKTLGYDKSLDEFKPKFKTTYENTLDDLSKQTPLAEVKATVNPFRRNSLY